MPDDRSSAPGALTPERVTTATTVASGRVEFRRAMTLIAMTLVMPGSAQLVMGNKRIGRICVRIWLGFIALAALLVVFSLISRSGLFGLVTNVALLTIGRWVLTIGAVVWVLLLLDAWRLGRPVDMERRHRLWVTGLNGALCFAIAGVLLFSANLLAVQSAFIGTVFAAGNASQADDGRYNVLLLGGDSGDDRDGMRPDSLSVASIDAETGRTVVIGLPRNLEDVPFRPGSVMADQFPDGFVCDDCYLNSIHTWASDNAELFDSDDPGVEATVSAVEEITGLTINYHAMINMEGFAHLIDAVGGVTVDVKERTAIGGIGAPVTGWIEAGEQHLTGDQALWYSRSRVQNSDFSRMGRQKCVMNAMLQQLSPQKVLLNIENIAESGAALLQTDIPAGELGTFMDLALKAKDQTLSTVSLVPPVVFPGSPDYDEVRSLIEDAIADAEGRATTPPPLVSASLSVPDFTPPDVAAADPLLDNQSEDLAETC